MSFWGSPRQQRWLPPDSGGESPRQRHEQGHAPSKAPGEDLLFLSWLLVAQGPLACGLFNPAIKGGIF